jgi:hypothetical protein
MRGLEFSDDEEDVKEKKEVEDDNAELDADDVGELDAGDIEIHDVPMSMSEVLLYQPAAEGPRAEKVPKTGELSLNFFDSVTQEINSLPEAPEPSSEPSSLASESNGRSSGSSPSSPSPLPCSPSRSFALPPASQATASSEEGPAVSWVCSLLVRPPLPPLPPLPPSSPPS